MKKTWVIILVSILLLLLVTPICYANSAAPPSIIIIVANAPADLEIMSETHKFVRRDKANESYFALYYGSPLSNKLQVNTGGRTFEITLDPPVTKYENVFTLDLEKQTLAPGKSLSRSMTLISLRIILTLLIEALVFYLFWFRQKRSWLVFLIVNLMTRGILNLALNAANPIDSYVIFPLIFGELLVFIVELALLSTFVKEHGRVRRGLYVIVANLLSLVAGGYLFVVLPV